MFAPVALTVKGRSWSAGPIRQRATYGGEAMRSLSFRRPRYQRELFVQVRQARHLHFLCSIHPTCGHHHGRALTATTATARPRAGWLSIASRNSNLVGHAADDRVRRVVSPRPSAAARQVSLKSRTIQRPSSPGVIHAKTTRAALILAALVRRRRVLVVDVGGHRPPGTCAVRQHRSAADRPALQCSERVAEVLAGGDHVKQPATGSLETSRLGPQVARPGGPGSAAADGQPAAQRQSPAEIDQARANTAARAPMRSMRTRSSNGCARCRRTRPPRAQRRTSIAAGRADAARQTQCQRKALALELAGPRREDVAQGEAQLQSQQAALRDAAAAAQGRRTAPRWTRCALAGVEPGKSPRRRGRLTLAIVDPKWFCLRRGNGPRVGARGLRAPSAWTPSRTVLRGWVGLSVDREFTPSRRNARTAFEPGLRGARVRQGSGISCAWAVGDRAPALVTAREFVNAQIRRCTRVAALYLPTQARALR